MGIGGISIWQLLIVLAIVVLIFGTKRLRNIGGDLGGAIKSFKKGIKDEDEPGNVEDKTDDHDQENVAAGEAEKVDREK
ncbi:MAG: Sec-independent protein translocase subunit TatA [Cellvibrionaceae bacterium]